MTTKIEILVYADWQGLQGPCYMGLLSAEQSKGRRVFSFEYDESWLALGNAFLLDPEINNYKGRQFPLNKDNFGVFSDAMPDSWGRKLMQRRAVQKSRAEKKPVASLHEADYLLGVHDFTRMGALRFKTQPDGPFLDNNPHQPAPPWTSLRELQHAAALFEKDPDVRKWLELLLAPGSSLGGARPKANLTDEKGHIWIAKFPSINDTIEKGAWEYLAHVLALQSGISMAECKLEHIYSKHRTFLTKRFDRHLQERVHFSSAMTMTGYNEEQLRDHRPSYLEIAAFIQRNMENSVTDLHQLWRRIVFNIAVSNTDDHLRNHGFLLSGKNWRLSPAFDLNPSVDKAGLGLNIDLDNNELDLDLARSVGNYFQLTDSHMDTIIEEVRIGTANWRDLATEIGIARSEQELMSPAFTLDSKRSQNYYMGY